MSPQRKLLFASIFFAVFWTIGMIWWEGPLYGRASYAIFAVAGIVAGTLWYWLIRWWMKWRGQWSNG